MKRTVSGWRRLKCRYCGRSFPNVTLAISHRESECSSKMPAGKR